MSYPRRTPARTAQMLSLESRLLFAAAFPTTYDQYLVELINRGRANPTAEATRYSTDLNEGLNPGRISSTPKQPLAINPLITDAARRHSQWMIDHDIFSHNEGSADPEDRMRAAGYPFNLPWSWGENIGWSGSTGSIDIAQKVAEIHEDLYVDVTEPSRGHRLNLMNNTFREIGAGIVVGDFTAGSTYNAVMVTEDFGKSGNGVFLTGVAYNDSVANDNFYTPGEALGGVLVRAVRASDGAAFQTTTWLSGGYSLPIEAGTYTVTASGGGLGGTVTYNNVVIGSENVKSDFTPDNLDTDFATIASGKLTVLGTSASDSISVTKDATAYTITRNGTAKVLNASGVTSIDIYADDGDDYILIGSGVTLGAYIVGANGNDVIQGGDGPDTITAGAGKDKAYGGLGDDRVNGNGGHDRLAGEHGRDRIYGGDGDDIMEGGSLPDRLWGEAGNNVYYGHGGDDKFYSRNSAADSLYGGLGNDIAQIDAGLDTHETIEELLA